MGGEAVAAGQPAFDDVVGQGARQPLGGTGFNARKTGRPGGGQEHGRGKEKMSVP